MTAFIVVTVFVLLMFIGLGCYLFWLFEQPESNIFIMDEAQKVNHDKNREGIF